MVDHRAATACGYGFPIGSFAGDFECGSHFSSGGAGRRFPALGNSGVAAYGRRAGGARHGDVDSGSHAQTFWRRAGNGSGARDAALNFRSAVPARIWRVLGAADGGEVGSEFRDRLADGDAYGCGRAAFCVFRFCGADLLSAGAEEQRSCGRDAQRGGGAMSVERAVQLPMLARLNAYYTMTKPDVTLLVVMTT